MLKLLALAFVAADKAVATLEAEDGERVALEVQCTSDEVLAPIAARFAVPEAEAFTDEHAAKLAAFRKEFEETLTRTYETSQGRGQAQIELQNQMHPLMLRERKAKVADAVAGLVRNAPPDAAAQLRYVQADLVQTRKERDDEIAAGEKLKARVAELEAAAAAAPRSSAADSQSAATPASDTGA